MNFGTRDHYRTAESLKNDEEKANNLWASPEFGQKKAERPFLSNQSNKDDPNFDGTPKFEIQ